MADAYAELPNSFVSRADLFKIPVSPLRTRPNHISQHLAPQKTTRYGIGFDPARGVGKNFHSVHVLDARSLSVVATWRSNDAPIDKALDVIDELSRTFADSSGQRAYCLPETNLEGLYVLDQLRIRGVPVCYGDSKKPGWEATGKSQAALMDRLRVAVRDSHLTLIDDWTRTELDTVQFKGDSKKATVTSNPESHFDGGISLGLALLCCDRLDLSGYTMPRSDGRYKPGNDGGHPRVTVYPEIF
jgi:hypothetical protein